MMNKRILAVLAMIALLASVAGAKKEKTITYKDGNLTDAKYGYTMTVGENWKVKSLNEPDVERAFIQKKNYSINRMIQAYGGDYTIPTINLYAMEFAGTPEDFENLLKTSIEEHSSDNEIIPKLRLLRDAEFVVSGFASIDSNDGRQIIIKRNYKRLLSNDPYGSESEQRQVEKVINDHEVHEIYVFKKDNILFVFHAFSEREFYSKENKDEFEAMAASIKFQQ
jgi:hypothetical protein